ncbi:MAG: hypothetical protein ACI4JK_03435 [Oscillospiraceae bacterium]
MVKQIKIDENNVVICCSVGGFIEGGFDVEDIPDEVMACPSRWKYEDEKFVPNEAYSEPIAEEGLTLEDLALAVAELAEGSAADKLEIEMAIAELAEVILNG